MNISFQKLFLKDSLNDKLKNSVNVFNYVENKTINSNCIKLKYNIKKDRVSCHIYNFINNKRDFDFEIESYSLGELNKLIDEIFNSLRRRIK